MSAEIQTVRADLAAWSAGKPKAVQRAAANLDGWLAAVAGRSGSFDNYFGVDVLACTARAVETLRRATGEP